MEELKTENFIIDNDLVDGELCIDDVNSETHNYINRDDSIKLIAHLKEVFDLCHHEA